MRRRFIVLAVIAALAVVGGGVAPWAYSTFVNTSAKDRIEADPPPRLFSDADVAPIGRQIDAQQARAETLMRAWWSGHGASADDAAFMKFLESTLPPPPSASARAAEIKQVQALARKRTDSGVAAASWLEAHGKKDVWKLAAHDQAEMLSSGGGDAVKADVDAALKMSKKVADTLGAKYQQSAPYVIDPSLRPDHTVKAGQVCPCSYPSRHATAGAAATTYLSYTSPHRAGQYRWTLDEVAWSRVYMAGHVPSDITAGALLGDMIGEYVLVTHGQMPAPTS